MGVRRAGHPQAGVGWARQLATRSQDRCRCGVQPPEPLPAGHPSCQTSPPAAPPPQAIPAARLKPTNPNGGAGQSYVNGLTLDVWQDGTTPTGFKDYGNAPAPTSSKIITQVRHAGAITPQWQCRLTAAQRSCMGRFGSAA